MSMLEYTRNKLQEAGAFTPTLNTITQQVMNAIPFPTVHDRMKATIAVSHIMLFASQFRRNIRLWDETLVPINSISFIICDSGAGKDSSHRSAKRCFTTGYEILEKELKKRAKAKAIKRAENAGEELPDQEEIYKKYLDPIPPVETSVTTGPGLIKLINDTELHDLGATGIYSGEFGDELAYNQDLIENIKIISELYDLGVKEMTYTKGQEFRAKAINGQSVSALFIGSPTYILYDENTKRKFQIAFMSKLARRSWFCYVPEKIPEKDFSQEADPIKAMIEAKQALENTAKQARFMLKDYIESVTNYHLDKIGEDLMLHPEIFEIFETYKRYNHELTDTMLNKDSTSSLVRKHLQWKALKLAGAFALLDRSDVILPSHYIEAIQFAEMLDKDMEIFEHDLNKSYYERFSDYVKTLVTSDGKATVSVHDIKKHGFLSNVSKLKLQEMVALCAAYDKEGIYSVMGEGTGIQYEPIVKTDVISISFKPIDTTLLNKAVASNNKDEIRRAKEIISRTTAYGYEVADTTFAELQYLLEGDYAYSPFKFNNGVRSKDNIIGGTKWLVFDVDESSLTAAEMHFILSDINHHIALSSNPNNPYKYRILVELDSFVELSALAWKFFYKEVADALAIKADPLPQSQIFFSYAGREVFSNLEGHPLAVRDFVMSAMDKASTKSVMNNNTLTPAACKAQLADPLTTFHYAFEAPNGSGSRNIIRAMYHLRDLGGTHKEAVKLFHDIMDYWEVPFEKYRQENMLEQISRMF